MLKFRAVARYELASARFICHQKIMVSINDNKKGRGRPATGIGTAIGVRLQPEDLMKLDEWIADQPEKMSRPEAIRRMIKIAVTQKISQ